MGKHLEHDRPAGSQNSVGVGQISFDGCGVRNVLKGDDTEYEVELLGEEGQIAGPIGQGQGHIAGTDQLQSFPDHAPAGIYPGAELGPAVIEGDEQPPDTAADFQDVLSLWGRIH